MTARTVIVTAMSANPTHTAVMLATFVADKTARTAVCSASVIHPLHVVPSSGTLGNGSGLVSSTGGSG